MREIGRAAMACNETRAYQWRNFMWVDDTDADPFPHVQLGDTVRPLGGEDEPHIIQHLEIYMLGESPYCFPRTLKCTAISLKTGKHVSISDVRNWERAR